jgi:hypothetical protein
VWSEADLPSVPARHAGGLAPSGHAARPVPPGPEPTRARAAGIQKSIFAPAGPLSRTRVPGECDRAGQRHKWRPRNVLWAGDSRT